MIIDVFRDEYFFLSNFYPSEIEYKGILYETSEAAFQAQKCANEEDKKMFSNLTPVKARALGRKIALRKDWEKVKVRFMTEIVYEKFRQNKNLRKKLMKTNGIELKEGNDWGDVFWGVNKKGEGENKLGKILMVIRSHFINKRK